MASRLLDFKVDERDIAKVVKKLNAAQGKPLQVQVQRATYLWGDLLARRIKAATPRRTGVLRKSVRSRPIKRNFRVTAGVHVGPRAPHRHLVIRGHRIVTPGGRDTGRRSTPNPFVDRAARGFESKAKQLIKEAWRKTLI